MAQTYPVQVRVPFIQETLTTASANGTSFSPFQPNDERVVNMTLAAGMTGGNTFGGGTVKLQGSLDGVLWFDLTAMSLTAAGAIVGAFKLPYYRVIMTGSSGATVTYAVH